MSELLRTAHALALRISPTQPISPADLTLFLENAIERDELRALTLTLQHDASALIPREPRQAAALARVADEIAQLRLDARARADASLALANALNALGEFRAALVSAEQARSFGTELDDGECVARALCETAWAHTFIGDLAHALADVERARAESPAPLVHARCDWIQARVLRDQSHYPEAALLFAKARDKFQAAQLSPEAARCERELAHTYIRSERGEAFPLLERLRQTFEEAACVLDVALCDYFIGLTRMEPRSGPQALELLLRTRGAFASLGTSFFATWCDMALGIFYLQTNHLTESLQKFQQARDYFLSNDIRMEVSACDINLGSVYYSLNRYDEALTSYQEAARLSLMQDREVRVARIYVNMGLIYTKQGRYSQSLDLHHRALRIFASKDLALLAAGSHASLAACYRQLGQYDQALAHLRAREKSAPATTDEIRAARNIDLADLHLARGEIAEAVTRLEQARDVAIANGLDSFVAVCDRLLAQTMSDRSHALARVENARTLFLKHAQTVDAALCDLTEGELHLQWDEVDAAKEFFQRAQSVLSPAFPDQAWRTDYGLGQYAVALGNDTAALDHYLHAARTITTSRSALVTEQISNDFFARRQSVFDDALALALQHGEAASALEVIEASKARTFLTLLQSRDWKLARAADAYAADLIAREKQLRYQLAALRRRSVLQNLDAGEVLRGGDELAAISAAALAELNAVSQAYEAVVTQLRLAANGLAGVPAPAPFSLEKFRAAMHAEYGDDWCALDYWLDDASVVIATLTARHVNVQRRALSAFHRAILEQCANPDPSVRAWVYRQPNAADAPGFKYLRHLHRLLIPDALRARTLVIAPHRSLHALPFHALRDETQFLIEQSTLVYAPSLQVLQHLLQAHVRSRPAQPLALGVTEFGDALPSLPHATAELEALRQVFQTRGEYWLDATATRQRLLELNAAGKLREFVVLHFATHAILDRAAPHQSRVLLADEPLTVTDILDLDLDAPLVALSACQTVLGQGGAGDEWIGLARAFFYAGARGLLTTLWHVEDLAMAKLMERFYQHWVRGGNAAVALRQAQIEMIQEGNSLYHWAPLVLTGGP